MKQRGVTYADQYMYIDDFITLGKAGTQECESNLHLMLQACESTCTPIEPDKT